VRSLQYAYPRTVPSWRWFFVFGVGAVAAMSGSVFNLDTFPTVADDGWTILLVNSDAGVRTGTVYAVCLG
jgi:hypothetical protein